MRYAKRYVLQKFNVIGLDAWGNQEDGFEVNDLRYSGSFELHARRNGVSDEQILRAMGDYVSGNLKLEWHDEEFCSVDDADTGEPLYHLRTVDPAWDRRDLFPAMW